MRTETLLKDLNEVPKEPHLRADYFELRCLISDEGMYSRSDLEAAIRRQADTGRRGASGARAAVQLAAGGDSSASHLFGAELQEEQLPSQGDQPAREEGEDDNVESDRRELKGRTSNDGSPALTGEVVQILERRAKAFARTYPFKVEGELLELRPGPFSLPRQLYLYLLLASSYKFLARSTDREKTTKAFERLAVPVLKNYFGPKLTVHVFGTGARRRSRYHGNFKKALEKLSQDIKIETTKRWDREADELSASGDRGLDVVGWIPFADSDPEDMRMVLFGQCATGKSWKGKQLEASRPRWGRILSSGENPLTEVLLISFCWRDRGGFWPEGLDITANNILFDRERIVFLLAKERTLSGVPLSISRDFTSLAGADAS